MVLHRLSSTSEQHSVTTIIADGDRIIRILSIDL